MNRSTFLLAAALFATGACRAGHDRIPEGNYVPARQSNADIERAVFHQVNRYRISRQLPPLAGDPALSAAAREHSAQMARRRKLSHSGFDGRFQRLQPHGFRGLAENVAMSLGLPDPATSAVTGWRRSRGHHKNMVTRSHHFTGIGVARGRDGSVYLTQLFGSR